MKHRPHRGPRVKYREMQNRKGVQTLEYYAHRRTQPNITRPELFLIPCDLVTDHNMTEAYATYRDMETLGLAQLPYPNCIIGVPGHTVFKLCSNGDKKIDVTLNPETNTVEAIKIPTGSHAGVVEDIDDIIRIYHSFEARFYYHHEQCVNILVRSNSLASWKDLSEFSFDEQEMREGCTIAGAQLRILLIVLLATKNIQTTRTKDKLIALGIGKNSRDPLRPIYTTTISLPAPTEPASHILIPGPAKRPHLRRGHIRQQKHGPRLSFTRAIWIKPCFINTTEEDFTSTREAYNTSLPPSHSIPPHHHP